jgi:hypothetical protein
MCVDSGGAMAVHDEIRIKTFYRPVIIFLFWDLKITSNKNILIRQADRTVDLLGATTCVEIQTAVSVVSLPPRLVEVFRQPKGFEYIYMK